MGTVQADWVRILGGTVAESRSKKDDVLIYTGGATTRRITEEEWKGAGVENQGTVVFDKSNNHRIPLNELTEPARQLLLDGHKGEFSVNKLEIPAPNGE
jgi:hypothetical protein